MMSKTKKQLTTQSVEQKPLEPLCPFCNSKGIYLKGNLEPKIGGEVNDFVITGMCLHCVGVMSFEFKLLSLAGIKQGKKVMK